MIRFPPFPVHGTESHRESGRLDFEREIAPLLARQRLTCHHALDPNEGIDLLHQTALCTHLVCLTNHQCIVTVHEILEVEIRV